MNFITGDGFRNLANFIFDENGFEKNENISENQIPIYFVKTDYIDIFFTSKNLLPKHKFKLITHNSDYDIHQKHLNYINYDFLEVWFAQNVNYIHEKLIPIPIGIANRKWPHGNTDIFQEVINQNNKKEQLIYANFNIHTNPHQRQNCIQHIPSKFIESNVSFKTYLEHTSQAYFSICPLGNGIDSHRIWESLYLKSIPIVEKTYNISYLIHKYKLPIIKINDWKELHSIDLSCTLYHRMISNFNPNILRTENFL